MPLVDQRLKHLPAMQETWVQSLGPEDPLEKEMAAHSSILAWRIPWTVEPGGLQSMGSHRVIQAWARTVISTVQKTKEDKDGQSKSEGIQELDFETLPGEKWSTSCHISQQGCQSSGIPALQMWISEPRGHPGRRTIPAHPATIRLQPLPTVSTEELRRWKHRQEASESWDAYERNDSSEPRLLHLPIYRKELKSLTWDVWFSFIIDNNHLMF